MPKPKYDDLLAERDALKAELEAIKSLPTDDVAALKAEIKALKKQVLVEGTGKYVVTTPQGCVRLAGEVVDSSFKLTKKLEKDKVFMKLFKESIANGLIKEV